MAKTAREPMFNVPAVVLALLGAFVVVHSVRFFLSDDAGLDVLLRFAFIPARYDENSAYAAELAAYGAGPKAWTFLTHAFLHGDLAHLAVNSVAMLAFGSAVAWRFGAVRFLAFFAICAAAGAAAHLAVHFGELSPVIGASGAISGQMAAAMRFMFQSGGPLSAFRPAGREAFSVPAQPLSVALRNRQVLMFLAAWFVANLVFGIGGAELLGSGGSIAWEAHIGGFVAGLALFSLFDPKVGRRAEAEPAAPGLRPPQDRPHDDADGAAGRP